MARAGMTGCRGRNNTLAEGYVLLRDNEEFRKIFVRIVLYIITICQKLEANDMSSVTNDVACNKNG